MTMFVPLDGTRARRRLYLIRHGHVAYYDDQGRPLNPKGVGLSEQGRAQADAVGAALAGIPIDRAICSGLPRTRQTAERALSGRGLGIEDDPAFLEIRAGRVDRVPPGDRHAAYITGFDRVDRSTRFAGGDGFAEVYDRVTARVERLVVEPGWTHLALFAHDGVNRMILAWACRAGLAGLSAFEQDYGGLNIVDVDVVDGRLDRCLIRTVNSTPGNPAKRGLHSTSLEIAFTPLLSLP
ncbi:histidine phosphatase family protein [Azospirillum griseum]|uniref:Histidine phosphatase family protein n=1 Tax=Azospirillum griseum TaxID=2496639 RepID=A0A3S0HTH7_9PROT|nr:histidine phosphatase family protein [Azospirillum griseum]RTR13039.1 histidine phosphatase family protein [Azospirillum griseum]